MSAGNMWRVRGASSKGEGRSIEYERLARAISDGVLGEEDLVRGPKDAGWILIGEHPQLEEHVPQRPLFRPRGGQSADMDMTPMIDVTFQLLIFFMLTAAFVVQKTLDMPPARQDGPVIAGKKAREGLFVKLQRNGTITVRGKPTPLEGLAAALREASKALQDRELFLDVDDDVAHERVVQVIDRAAEAEIHRVLFVYRKAPQPKTG